MKKFEYKTIKIRPGGFFGNILDTKKIDAELSSLGQQGWELVSVYVMQYARHTVFYTFKRPY
ncbi:DUF4177 domain-containing protein [Sphingobacterium sp. Mn56C]|uniref:DUF4177 domain-containing protein n=1 Tax=Sphingobacterium sp. Mn56C TaxID=3395261 RepID=UPI003BDFB75B